MSLKDANVGQTYIIENIKTNDDEVNSFLFRLGCYSGEPITIMSKKRKGIIVSIKDGRYNFDNLLAESILVH
ncbi:MAG: ferrous iron transport protein A [Eubacterium sp.]|nr:ferrous iron transport protein A [Candidatus Colimonas fimequi]